MLSPTTGIHGRSGSCPRSSPLPAPTKYAKVWCFWKRASVFAGNSLSELKFYRWFNQGQTCLCVCEQDRLALYQVLKRSPRLSRSTLEHNKGKRCFNTHPGGECRRSSRKDVGPGWTQDPYACSSELICGPLGDICCCFSKSSTLPRKSPFITSLHDSIENLSLSVTSRD